MITIRQNYARNRNSGGNHENRISKLHALLKPDGSPIVSGYSNYLSIWKATGIRYDIKRVYRNLRKYETTGIVRRFEDPSLFTGCLYILHKRRKLFGIYVHFPFISNMSNLHALIIRDQLVNYDGKT